MLTITRSKLPVNEDTLRASLATYVSALEDHAKTEGQEAPWPEYEILRDIVAGEGFVVVDDTDDAETPLNAYINQIKQLLNKSDIIVIRCIELGVNVPKEWVEYRKDLRVLANSTEVSSEFPTPPDRPKEFI